MQTAWQLEPSKLKHVGSIEKPLPVPVRHTMGAENLQLCVAGHLLASVMASGIFGYTDKDMQMKWAH